MNLLIALCTQGLLGAAFPATGIPGIPKPQSTHLDPVVHVVGGDGSRVNPGATPKTAGGVDERMDQQWSGPLTWQGTGATLNERKEVCAEVTATASKGDPCAFSCKFHSLTIRIHPPIQIGINMAESLVTCACWTCGVSG